MRHILLQPDVTQAVVFLATKRDCDRIAQELGDEGFSVAAMHGDMEQRSRNWTLNQLRQGRVQVLVATDVAARGIDVPGLSHVINYDLPRAAEDYVHRIGRTGRAGRSGVAITLTTPADGKYIDAITRLIQKDIPEGKLSGEAAPSQSRSEPSDAPAREERSGRGSGARRRGGESRARPEPARQEQPSRQEQPVRQERPDRQDDRPQRPERKDSGRSQRAPAQHIEGIVSDSPFGSDGPIPAFLLRK
jgi:superfamily II DNA/RNA helicase